MKPRPPSKAPRLEGDALLAHVEAQLSETPEERAVKAAARRHHTLQKEMSSPRPYYDDTRVVTPTYRAYGGKSLPKLKRTKKRRPTLLDDLRRHIKELQAASAPSTQSVRKESLAVKFQVSQGRVEACLAKLNQEGLVRQPVHPAYHDSPRNRMFPGSDSGWCPDIYYVVPAGEREERLREKRRR